MDISGGLGMLPQLDGSDAYFTVSDLISASHNWDFRVLRTYSSIYSRHHSCLSLISIVLCPGPVFSYKSAYKW